MKAIYCLDRTSFELIYGDDERMSIAELVDVAYPLQDAFGIRETPGQFADVEIILSGWGGPILDQSLLDALPKLKLILYGAGSVKYMLTDEFWERNIKITSAYAGNAVPVVEFTLSQILFGLKNGWQQARLCREEKSFVRLPMAGGYGSTVGLVSMGMIGKMVAERLESFDLKIIAYDPFIQEYPGVEMVTLDTLFQRSDMVSLHTPWLKETEGLIGRSLLRQMKPNATFLNTSRGAVVSEDELIDVLGERPDLTAVLDVTYPEPPLPESALYTLPNVVLTPHIAGSVGPECRRMGQIMVDELRRFLAGDPLKYGISREKAAVMA